MDSSEDDLIIMAKLAEQAERYDEMAEYMLAVAERSNDLPSDHRNLLSVAFKNVVGAKRSSWRVLNTQPDEPKQGNERIINELKVTVEEELRDICNKVLVKCPAFSLTSKSTAITCVSHFM